MNLKTNETLQIKLNGRPSNELHVRGSYTVLGATSQSAGTIRGNTDGGEAVNLTPTVPAGTTHLLERLNVYNPDTLTWKVTIQVSDGAYTDIMRSIDLQAGETLTYTPNSWHIATGTNEGGVIILPVSTSDIVAADRNPVLYSKTICGRDFLKFGVDDAIQAALWNGSIVDYKMNGTAGVWAGTTGANLGTATSVAATNTNLYTMMRRQGFATVVTTANQQVGTRTEALFIRGDAANKGGFFAVAYFGFQKILANERLYVGFCTGTTAVVTVQPSTLVNTFGFCIEAGDTAISLLHNDNAGTGVKETITGQPALANNQGYVAYIYCKPNDTTMYWRLDDMNTKTMIAEGSVSTELPDNSTFLNFQCVMSNGSNVAAGDAHIGVGYIYIR